MTSPNSFEQAIEAGHRAANYRDGKAVGFETFAKFATADLGYMLEIERLETKVAGADESVRSRCACVAAAR